MPDQDQTLIPYEPEIPKWEFWRQKGGCRLWVAVLLSLNIEPTVQNRTTLAERLPDRYAEFSSRRLILRTQYGLHPLEVFATAFASVFAWFNNVGAFMIDSIASFGNVWCGVVMLRSAGAADPNERLRDKQRDV